MLGVTLWSADQITSAAKTAASKLGLSRGYFTSNRLLVLCKAEIRPCLEYGCHFWRRTSKHSLATLNAIQKRAINLIGDPAVSI